MIAKQTLIDANERVQVANEKATSAKKYYDSALASLPNSTELKAYNQALADVESASTALNNARTAYDNASSNQREKASLLVTAKNDQILKQRAYDQAKTALDALKDTSKQQDAVDKAAEKLANAQTDATAEQTAYTSALKTLKVKEEALESAAAIANSAAEAAVKNKYSCLLNARAALICANEALSDAKDNDVNAQRLLDNAETVLTEAQNAVTAAQDKQMRASKITLSQVSAQNVTDPEFTYFNKYGKAVSNAVFSTEAARQRLADLTTKLSTLRVVDEKADAEYSASLANLAIVQAKYNSLLEKKKKLTAKLVSEHTLAEKTSKKNTSKTPKTGDETPALLYTAELLDAAAAVYVITNKKRREE